MKLKNPYLKKVKTLQIYVQVVPTAVPFVLQVPDQIDKVQIHTKFEITEIQTITIDRTRIKTIDTTIVAVSKTTDKTIIAIHQISNQTETTQTNYHVDIVTERITSPGTVKPVLLAKDWDICLANVEHPDKIRTIGNKIRMLTKTRENKIRTAMQIPHSNKIP